MTTPRPPLAEPIYEVLDRIESAAEVPVGPDASPLDFLCAVYRDPGQPMSRRMRAAIEALPFVHPKLSATAIVGASGFGARLEAAIKRSGKVIEHEALKAITGEANSTVTD